MSERPEGPAPKSDETQPPAADRPVEEGSGDVAGGAPPPAHQDAAGRAANDPSMRNVGVPEVLQAPPGKPDGEVDTRS